MYIREIEIENYGPIENLKIQPEFRPDGSPKPLILIGKNGGGKTIVLSHIVNALITAKQDVYENTEVVSGKVYKLRSPNYVRSGALFAYSSVQFDDAFSVSEWVLRDTKEQFEIKYGKPISLRNWEEIPVDSSNHFSSGFIGKNLKSKELIEKQCALYFPTNRFEEPGWLNSDNLLQSVQYTDLKHISGYSNRSIIATSPMKNVQRWILDILLDRNVLEQQVSPLMLSLPDGGYQQINVLNGFTGESSLIYEQLSIIIQKILRADSPIRFGIAKRQHRQISILKNEKAWIPNLFQLSTGETLLINLFFTIIRDFDLTGQPCQTLSDIKGVVVVDEIDAHLHATMQHDVLPQLIQLFPNVQFIVTSHSPLFVIGMEKTLGTAGCTVLELPTGEPVDAERFSEFEDYCRIVEDSERHRNALKRAILDAQKPLVFVEGDYDIRYLTKAAELFDRNALLAKFDFRDGDGFGNLNNVWKSLESKVSKALTSRILLIYDCDTKKIPGINGLARKDVMPFQNENPIAIGIENLFPKETINMLESANPAFIDTKSARSDRVRGETIQVLEEKLVSKDEKKNICNWLCANGTKEDFIGVNLVLDQIEDWLDLH